MKRLILLFLISYSYATVDTLSTGHQDTVQAHINSATRGDTIYIPAGEWTYTTSVNAPSVSINKAIHFMGAGYDSTIFHDATGNGDEAVMFGIDSGYVTFSYVQLDSMRKTNSAEPAIIIQSTADSVRVHHCSFYGDLVGADPGRGVTVAFKTKHSILIDSCYFYDTQQGIQIFGEGDDSWTQEVSFGSADFVFIENNVFSYASKRDGCYDAYNGARYVFRYNQVTNTNIGHHGRDSGGYRSTHLHEIYENTFTATGLSTTIRTINSRGGTGVIYNNAYNGQYKSRGLELAYYCCFKPETSCGDPWTECRSYPCVDQPGRGSNQDSVIYYEWNNTLDGNDIDFWIYEVDPVEFDVSEEIIVEGRDYFNDTSRPNYTAYTYPHPLTQAQAQVGSNTCDVDEIIAIPAQ